MRLWEKGLHGSFIQKKFNKLESIRKTIVCPSVLNNISRHAFMKPCFVFKRHGQLIVFWVEGFVGDIIDNGID